MKNIFLLLLLCMISYKGISQKNELQVWKYKVSSVMMRAKNSDTWSNWAKPKKGSELIGTLMVLDLINHKLSAYLPIQRDYSIISVINAGQEVETNTLFSFSAVDYKNEKCLIFLIIPKSNSRNATLQIAYPKVEMELSVESQDY